MSDNYQSPNTLPDRPDWWQSFDGKARDWAHQRAMQQQQSAQQDRALKDLYDKLQQISAQKAEPRPNFRNAVRATLAQDGIVIEDATGHERMVVRGDLLKTLEVLIRLAALGGLVAPDEDGQPGVAP